METVTYPIHDVPKSDLSYIYDRAYEQTDVPLKDNYGKHLNYDGVLAISITYNNNPISVSSVLERPFFNYTVRCLNRYFYDSSLIKGLHIEDYDGWMRKSTVLMLDQQLEFSEKLGIDGYFVSTSHHKLFRNRSIKGFNKHSKYDWKLAPNYMLVVDNEKEKLSCWQTVIYSGRLGLSQSRKSLEGLS